MFMCVLFIYMHVHILILDLFTVCTVIDVKYLLKLFPSSFFFPATRVKVVVQFLYLARAMPRNRLLAETF